MKSITQNGIVFKPYRGWSGGQGRLGEYHGVTLPGRIYADMGKILVIVEGDQYVIIDTRDGYVAQEKDGNVKVALRGPYHDLVRGGLRAYLSKDPRPLIFASAKRQPGDGVAVNPQEIA